MAGPHPVTAPSHEMQPPATPYPGAPYPGAPYPGAPSPPQFGAAPPPPPQFGSAPPPTAATRLPWPPPPGSAPPASLPPSGQLPPGPQQQGPPGQQGPPPYGAPVPQDEMSDTQRMLQPQGLFSSPRPFEPQPWPGADGAASLYAPPLPSDAGPREGSNQTLPHGMQPVPPGGTYQPAGPYSGGPYPPGPYPPGGPFPPGPPQGGKRGPWSRLPSGPLTPAIIAVVLVLVVAGVVIAAMHGSSNSPGSTAGTTSGGTPTATASANSQAEKQAATQLAALLPQSGADRGKVVNAVVDVQNCGKNVAQDAATFSTAASNRQTLVTKLGSLPGRAALPPAMVSALTGAWQASAQADADLAKWAQDESHGCRKSKTGNDANLKASYGPDGQATTDKQSFTRQWNPLARKYGLKTYQVGDL